MSSTVPQFNLGRLRSYIFRIPLCTRVLLCAILLFWIAGVSNGFQQWAQLVPEKIFAGEMHRLSTYPYLHLGFIHTLVNVIALTPLLEKFETENGTIVTAVLFTGPFSTFPGAIYTLICYVLGIKTPVEGASIWFFILLTSTLYRASRSTPRISIPSTTYTFPTALTPLVIMLLTSFIVPHTSLLGHMCGALIGYFWGAGYAKLLLPPEKILRWIEERLSLRSRLPGCYVSVEKLTYGRYGLGVLPTSGPILPNGDEAAHV